MLKTNLHPRDVILDSLIEYLKPIFKVNSINFFYEIEAPVPFDLLPAVVVDTDEDEKARRIDRGLKLYTRSFPVIFEIMLPGSEKRREANKIGALIEKNLLFPKKISNYLTDIILVESISGLVEEGESVLRRLYITFDFIYETQASDFGGYDESPDKEVVFKSVFKEV